MTNERNASADGTHADDRSGKEVVEMTPEELVRWRLVEFTRALRAAGVDVSATASLDAARVLTELGMLDRERTRAGLRAALVSDPADIATFDRLFITFWRYLVAELDDWPDPEAVREQESDPEVLDLSNADPLALRDSADEETELGETDMLIGLTDDRDERGRQDDNETAAGYDRSSESTAISGGRVPSTDAKIQTHVTRIDDALARLTARGDNAASRGDRIDVRRALRNSFQTGGVVLSTPMRAPKRTATRYLFLVDVSRSVLDVLDRDFLVYCLATFQKNSRSMRTFFFDTALQEVTAAVDKRTVADTYETLERLEAGWGGGTRIGEAITDIRGKHPDAVDRRTVVIMISDGLETGDVDELESGMAWISQRANIVLWWNPLAMSPKYEPTCRGMVAAIPFVDGLFAFAGVDDLREIARQLFRYDGTQPLGYERTADT